MHSLEYTRSMLAERLLDKDGADLEKERNLLGMFRLKFGIRATVKMVGMVNNVSSSGALTAHRAAADRGLDFSVKVLTFNFWPSRPQVELSLPPALEACRRDVAARELTARRKLTWSYTQWGDVTLTAAYPGKQYKITLSLLQACVLLLFNDTDEALSLEQVKSRLGYVSGEFPDAVRLLLGSLSTNPKVGPLLLFSKEARTYAYNPKFSSKYGAFSVPLPSGMWIKQERIQETVRDEQNFRIQAAIVRVMKARKFEMHQVLMAEVGHQVRRAACLQ